MKKGLVECPFCKNEIKNGAIKCQYCHEYLDKSFSQKGKRACPFCKNIIDMKIKKCPFCGELLNSSKKGIIKTLLIVLGFVIISAPIIYYFCFALPKHNNELKKIELDKIEYQKKQDEEKALKEIQMKEQYDLCMANAKREYDNIDKYCELGYQECKLNVEEYNANLIQKYDYFGNSNEKDVNKTCGKYKNNGTSCFLLDKYDELRESDYERALANCNLLYK